MDKQFWRQLQQLVFQSNYQTEVKQAVWENLVQLAANPTLPFQLIIDTISKNAGYAIKHRSSLNFPAVQPNISLSRKQQTALELSLSNTPVTLVSGIPGSGKTRIARALADVANKHQKSTLLLTHYQASTAAFRDLTKYSFFLSQPQDNRSSEELQQQLAVSSMSYLPLHLLPDKQLEQLRCRKKLESWYPTIENESYQRLVELLQQAFPELCKARIEVFAYRLKQLAPLLQENLSLSQLYTNLSGQGVNELASILISTSKIPVIGTITEFFQLQQHQEQSTFDLVIVEEGHYLNWFELIFLAGITQKLVLFGDIISPYQIDKTIFPNGSSFNWFAKTLLPNNRFHLTEQYRLHPNIAAPVYSTISDEWILTNRPRALPYLPQLPNRLIWQDISNLDFTETSQIWKFLQTISSERIPQIGIITYEKSHSHLLKRHCPQEFSQILIGTVAEWAGQERDIIIVCFMDSKNIVTEDLNVSLTRSRDYLILFGDYDYWWKNTLLRPLLACHELQRIRTVILNEQIQT